MMMPVAVNPIVSKKTGRAWQAAEVRQKWTIRIAKIPSVGRLSTSGIDKKSSELPGGEEKKHGVRQNG